MMRRGDHNADVSLLGLLLFGRDEQQRVEHERLLDFFVNRTKIATRFTLAIYKTKVERRTAGST